MTERHDLFTSRAPKGYEGKMPHVERGIGDVHPAAWDAKERIRLMDELGIDAQVLYPNSIGLGGQNLWNSIEDKTLVRLCVEVYNDALAEVQAESGNRLLPMPIMPAWDVQ